MKHKRLKVVDLFAGCGGLSLGFQNAGFDVIAAFDNWQPAIDVYKLNFEHPVISQDLSDIKASVSSIKEFSLDMIVGGPPCQDFSHAGKRNENGGRANLTISYANIVTSLKPQFFVMENVDRIDKTNTYKKAIDIFRKAGYGLTPYLFNANLYDVPQTRKRFVVVGELNGLDNAFHPYFKENESGKPMTIRDYLGLSLGIEHYYRHPRNYNRRGVFSIDEPSPTVRGVNRPIPGGYKGHPNDSSSLNNLVRPLTTIERSYIQTFPKSFIFKGSKTNLEQIIGNAVPVKLAEHIGNAILKYINDEVKLPMSSDINAEQTSLLSL